LTKNFKLVLTMIIGLIVIGITITVFFLGTVGPRVSLDWQSLSFVLLSELLLFGMLTFFTMSSSTSNAQIIKTGILSTLTIYWAVSVIFALLRHLFAKHQNIFVIINILLIGIVIIVSILFNMVALKIQSIDKKTSNSMLFLQDIEKRLYSLASNDNYSEFKQGLHSLYEKVRFSDKIGTSSHDKTISDEMDNLEKMISSNAAGKKEKTEKAISQILFLIKQRNMEISQSKRGGF